jgi:hypothetical protein
MHSKMPRELEFDFMPTDRYEAACDRTFQAPTLPGPGIQTRLDLIGSIAGLEPSLINENQRIARTGDTAVAPNIANAATTTDTTATRGTTSPATP